MKLDRLRFVRRLAHFAPPVGWMGVIALFSSSLFAADRTESWVTVVLGWLLPAARPETLAALHTGFRKLGHVIEYGILAVLWRRALSAGRPSRRAVAWAIGLSTLYAMVDEAVWQRLAAKRTPSAGDVVIDTVGALVALASWESSGPLERSVVRVARWGSGVLAVGSLAVALVDLGLGLAVGDLLVAALGLGLTAWGLSRLTRASRAAPTSTATGSTSQTDAG